MNEKCCGGTEYKFEVVEEGNESYFKVSIKPFPIEILNDQEIKDIYIRNIAYATREATYKHGQLELDRKYK